MQYETILTIKVVKYYTTALCKWDQGNLHESVSNIYYPSHQTKRPRLEIHPTGKVSKDRKRKRNRQPHPSWAGPRRGKKPQNAREANVNGRNPPVYQMTGHWDKNEGKKLRRNGHHGPTSIVTRKGREEAKCHDAVSSSEHNYPYKQKQTRRVSKNETVPAITAVG